MVYIESWTSLNEFIEANGIVRWNISRSRGNQSNDNVFLYNTEQSMEENIQKTIRLLEMFAGDMLYFNGWNNEKTRTNGFSAVIQYPQRSAAPWVQPPTVNGVNGAFDRETITADIRRQLKNEFDQERLSRERKEFEERKREFDSKQESVVGLLVHYLAPVAQQLAGRLPLPKVAGIDAEEPVQAQPIHAAPADQRTVEEENAEKEPFEDWEVDKLNDLIKRFKAVEPKYLELIEQVVTMAENGDRNYVMAKQFMGI